jgi:hypothetical protein
MHENPIAPVHHLPGNLCVTGLIRIPQVPSAQIREVKDETDSDKKKNVNPFGRGVDAERVSREMKVLSLVYIRPHLSKQRKSFLRNFPCRNPGKHWLPGQARNDKLNRTYAVMYS